jgi:putative flavoprotein involved in K+ transport
MHAKEDTVTSETDVVVIGAGQAGLSAAWSLLARGISPVVLEAGPEPVGSWPHYYDSLTLFSPVTYSSMPGLNFPGHPDHYPHRDEVVSYLRRHAAGLDADICTNTPVTAVEAHGQDGFVVRTAAGETVRTRGVVCRDRLVRQPLSAGPARPGPVHRATVAHGRLPQPVRARRRAHCLVGAGNSAVQVGYELAQVATVSLATRHPVIFVPQCRGGKDVHYWLKTTGFDLLPPEWLRRYFGGRTVDDTGKYQHALETGQLDRRPMFTTFDADGVIWPDGTREQVDTVLFATGYRPHLDYLRPLGALAGGMPLHSGGISDTHLAWSTSGWSSSGRSPPTPCAECTGTPST